MITIKIGVTSFDGTFFPDIKETKVSFDKTFSDGQHGIKIIWELGWGCRCYCLHTARNRLIYSAPTWWENFEPPYDYFFSMDNDNGIDVESFIELIRIAKTENDNCIVSAAYRGRHPGYKDKIVAGNFDKKTNGHIQISVADFLAWPADSFPREVEIVGGGAVLIPRKVIVELPKPIYQHESLPIAGSVRGDMVYLCEDQSLCRAVRKAGFKVLLARAVSSHRGAKIII